MENDNDREAPGKAVHAVMKGIHRDFLQFLTHRLEKTCRSCPIHGYLDRGCDSGADQINYGGAAG